MSFVQSFTCFTKSLQLVAVASVITMCAAGGLYNLLTVQFLLSRRSAIAMQFTVFDVNAKIDDAS